MQTTYHKMTKCTHVAMWMLSSTQRPMQLNTRTIVPWALLQRVPAMVHKFVLLDHCESLPGRTGVWQDFAKGQGIGIACWMPQTFATSSLTTFLNRNMPSKLHPPGICGPARLMGRPKRRQKAKRALAALGWKVCWPHSLFPSLASGNTLQLVESRVFLPDLLVPRKAKQKKAFEAKDVEWHLKNCLDSQFVPQHCKMLDAR